MIRGSYHDRQGMIAWADGHVEAHRWTDDRTLSGSLDYSPESSPENQWHMHRHASPGNPDLLYSFGQPSQWTDSDRAH